MQNNCVICDSPLSPDDIGASRKLINRGLDKDFLCVDCLAERYGITPDALRERIEFWREGGCMLFPKK